MDDDEPRAGEATTPNYGWTMPTVGASDDAWGSYLNSDLLSIDSIVHGIDIRPSGVTISDTAPASPAVGALWWDSVGGQLYTFYNDGNSSQWVTASNATASLLPASTTVLGAVKVDGTTIKAAADGTISTTVVPLGDNRIINGDMRIDQRNGGASTTPTTIGSTYVIDRWLYNASQASKGTSKNSIATATLFSLGANYVWVFQSLSAYTSLAADTFQFGQKIEADMIGDFAWGTPGAQPVTLSFIVAATTLGTYSGVLRNAANDRSYPFTFNVAGGWNKIVITIPGDTSGTWVLSGNANALYVLFDLGNGANARTSAGAWVAGNYGGVTGSVSTVATNNATFQITNVKLEIGSVATPFNRQSLAKSMADCQRYYQNVNLYSFFNGAAGVINVTHNLPATMRITPPTIGFVAGTPNYYNCSGLVLAADSPSFFHATVNNVGGGCQVFYTLTASAEL